MASLNFNPFDNWFHKPPNPLPPINLLSFSTSLKPRTQSPNFASISSSITTKPDPTTTTNNNNQDQPGYHTQMLEQFYWECANRPDYRHAPEVERILNDDPVFEKKENPTQEEVEENANWLKGFQSNPVVEFFAQAENIRDYLNDEELKKNSRPFRDEDKKLWEALPLVTGVDGRPMPRKRIRNNRQMTDKAWDFVKEFLFGLWGFKQRPYPPGRPNDVAQAMGYKGLERRYYDFIMRGGRGFYYKDRLGRTRGPLQLITLKTAWGSGVIDKDTFVYGEDMDEWVPIHMVYGLEPAIATWEVRLGAAATAFIHKIQKGIPPWAPLKGQEKKTYVQLQAEAVESKKRDLAVLEANGGVWPGVRTPSHALFLWASGAELTPTLEADHMPNKYIPKDLRKQLAKAIPGLRPWEVLSIEQAMDQITYGGQWYREPLGLFTTGPPYIRRWTNKFRKRYGKLLRFQLILCKRLAKGTPYFFEMIEDLQNYLRNKRAQKMAEKEARRRAGLDY